MKIKELIKKLEKLENKIGDVEVGIIIEDFDGTETGILDINEVDISTDINGENPEVYIGYFYNKED